MMSTENKVNIVLSIYLSILTFSYSTYSIGAELYFNPEQLENIKGNDDVTDLTMFDSGDGLIPGIYKVDIYLNDEYKDTKNINFKMVSGRGGGTSIQPCLSVDLLSNLGLNTDKVIKAGVQDVTCGNWKEIAGISTRFDFSEQKLMLSIPQIEMKKNPRGYLSDKYWDEGIPAALLNYSVSGAKEMRGKRNNNSSQYINLRPGININSWRFRNYTTWQHDNAGTSRWDTLYSYIQRDIIKLKSQLTLGDSNSPGDIFDSVPFRGFQLASDDDMLPDSIKGYAPIVRGVAKTNAKVLIRQNGYVIYQTYVAPGAFEINDIYPTGSSGDLQVDIEESDGSKQNFRVPFASSPILQREGRLKFDLTGGYYRAYDNAIKDTPFLQGTAIYGLADGATGYGGEQLAKNYQSLSLGIGKNLGVIGAISTDVTQSWSKFKQHGNENGQSWRIRYSKNFTLTGTNFSIAGYRYSTSGYATLQETLDTYRHESSGDFITERTRNRIESNVEQLFTENYGGIMLSLISEDYWEKTKSMRSLALSYHNAWKSISYGVNYNYNKNSRHSSHEPRKSNHDQVLAFNISIPLSDYNLYATYSSNSSQHGGTTQSAGLSGSAFSDNRLDWSLQQGYGSAGEGYSGSLNADYRGGSGNVNFGYSYNPDSKRINYGLQGGVIAHTGGITLGQPLGETFALVQAKGATGLGIYNQTGVKTDRWGYAIIPYVSPYRKNVISLDPETLSADVDIQQMSTNVIPTRGAVVKANFDTRVGQRALITLKRPGGGVVPFGAMVTLPEESGSKGFIVAYDGQVYLNGMAEKGKLLVTWGERSEQQCRVDYNYSDLPTHNGIWINEETCNQ